ncbi:MAG: type II toxin-antitoxin system prevent-host-death family antitoxin [Fimbriimonadaceae bacterium]|nr:type II toxin-antitoxin system prevent-host-death family antitoxin [Fimbriimonadaceae bacterium]
MRSLSATDFRRRYSAVLNGVADGEPVVTERRGRPVAMLSPVRPEPDRPTVAEVVTGLRVLREGYSLGGLREKDLIEEGRKY